MTTDEIIATLRDHMNELRAMGLTRVALFGSAARGEMRPGSDVDLLVDFRPGADLIDAIRIELRIEELLGVPHVDLVQHGAEHPAIRDEIHAEAINVA